MLEECARWRRVSYLAHRTIHELDWFCTDLIFGKAAKILETSPELQKYPDFVAKLQHAGYDEKHPFRPFIKLFHEYCEIIYVKEEMPIDFEAIDKLGAEIFGRETSQEDAGNQE